MFVPSPGSGREIPPPLSFMKPCVFQGSGRGSGEEEWAQLLETHEVVAGGTERHPIERVLMERDLDSTDTDSALSREL
jgi:hypothetical protein